MRTLFFAAATLASLGAILPAQAKVLRIMPLGDSITECRDGDSSYRYYLWRHLMTQGQCVDFVGSRSGVRAGEPKYPNFDLNHEGHWGWRTDEILTQIPTWAAAAQPDVVLCHVGTNDLWQFQDVASTVAELGQVIDALRAVNPKIHILLAKIIPVGPSFALDVTPLNNALPALVASKHTDTSRVILVDHFTGWDAATHTYDDVHTNDAGSQRMARTWFRALVAANLNCTAGFKPYGSGCAGTVGVPTLDRAAGQIPQIGQFFAMHLGTLPPNAPIAGQLGFSSSYFGVAKLPVDLGIIGMPGCDLLMSPAIQFIFQATPAGTATWSLGRIPNDAILAGLRFYVQAFVRDVGANSFGFVSTNAAEGVLGYY